MSKLPSKKQIVVIGGGQAGLAVGYFLKRLQLDFLVIDEQAAPGGAWRHTWKSLRLFSPGEYSSLPGWLFPKSKEPYPTRDEVIAYLKAYEQRYTLPVERPVNVQSVERTTKGLRIRTDLGAIDAEAVVSCTGTWRSPYIPNYPGREEFEGLQVHSAHYSGPEEFTGKRVLIVGGGNSGAQILAEVSKVASATWVTEREPSFLDDAVDGRILFAVATQRYHAQESGRPSAALPTLGDIVMVESVKEARSRGVLKTVRPFSKMTAAGVVWSDGTHEEFQAVVWCTGFRPSLKHLASLGILNETGRIEMKGTRCVKEPLWLVGYGEWTGFGSATLIGVQRYARATASEVQSYLQLRGM